MPASQYLGRIATLATQHGKESVIAPAFAEIAGLTVQVAAIDTDRFGTFSGEVKRSQAPLATAVKKALAGMSAENLRLGLASEGTIGPHLVSGFMNVDTEIIVFIDDELDLVITEKVQSSEIVAQTITAGPNDDLTDFLRKADFPRHGLIVKSDCPTSPEDPTARIAKESLTCPHSLGPSKNCPRMGTGSSLKTTSGHIFHLAEWRLSVNAPNFSPSVWRHLARVAEPQAGVTLIPSVASLAQIVAPLSSGPSRPTGQVVKSASSSKCTHAQFKLLSLNGAIPVTPSNVPS